MEVKSYSEKSYIVFGDTKEYKEQLKNLGGKFNMYLKHPETSEVVAGWIFKKTDDLIDEIEKIEKGFYVMREEKVKEEKEGVSKKSSVSGSVQSSQNNNLELIVMKNKIKDKIKSYEDLISKLESLVGVESVVNEYKVRLDELNSLL
jgi:hypothetical protein